MQEVRGADNYCSYDVRHTHEGGCMNVTPLHSHGPCGFSLVEWVDTIRQHHCDDGGPVLPVQPSPALTGGEPHPPHKPTSQEDVAVDDELQLLSIQEDEEDVLLRTAPVVSVSRDLLGRGRQGSVWLADDVHHACVRYAVKVVDVPVSRQLPVYQLIADAKEHHHQQQTAHTNTSGDTNNNNISTNIIGTSCEVPHDCQHHVHSQHHHHHRHHSLPSTVGLDGEVRLWPQVRHPGAVQLHGIETVNTPHGRVYHFISEHMPCGALSDFARQNYRHGQLPEDALRWFLKPVLECLHYMHSRRIVHLDVKADNIMVTWADEHGRCGAQATGSYRVPVAKLGDFGCARSLDNRPTNFDCHRKRGSRRESAASHHDEVRCGTPGFIAPEIISHLHGSSDAYTTAADVWSFACAALQLLRGAPPVRPGTHVAAILFETAMYPERVQRFIPPVKELVPTTAVPGACHDDQEVLSDDDGGRKEEEEEEDLEELTISSSLRDMLLKCLHPDPQKRATTDELLRHPFFMDETRPEDVRIREENQLPLFYDVSTACPTNDTCSSSFSNINSDPNSFIQCSGGGVKCIGITTGLMGSTVSTLFDGLSNSDGEERDEGDMIDH